MKNDPHVPVTRDFPPGRLQQRKEHLVNEVAAQQGTTPERRRRRVLVLVPAALALLVAMGFTTYALTREPTHFESIGCFENASEESNTAIVQADGRDPVAVCSEMWQQGAFGDVPRPDRLEACVLESGAVGVFPSSGTGACTRLGLAPLPASYREKAQRVTDLRDAIVRHLGEPASGSSLGDGKCIEEKAARALVRRQLDARGYTSWRIDVSGDGFTDERPCAEATIDVRRKVVTLIPVWR